MKTKIKQQQQKRLNLHLHLWLGKTKDYKSIQLKFLCILLKHLTKVGLWLPESGPLDIQKLSEESYTLSWMRGIVHVKLELRGLSVRHLQLKRNHHMGVFTKTFSVLMPLPFLFHIWRDQGQLMKERKNTLCWRKREWNSLDQSSFFPHIPLFSAGFLVWAEGEKGFD